jgi:hypothetical protein
LISDLAPTFLHFSDTPPNIRHPETSNRYRNGSPCRIPPRQPMQDCNSVERCQDVSAVLQTRRVFWAPPDSARIDHLHHHEVALSAMSADLNTE